MNREGGIIVLAVLWCLLLFGTFVAERYDRQENILDHVTRATGVPRSNQWPRVRQAHLTAHPCCEVCGTKGNLEVHHIVPFHIDKSKELEPSNLITLCQDHHLLFGHLMSWQSYNPDIIEDVKLWRKKIANRPKPQPKPP